jgi:hypothetical protein
MFADGFAYGPLITIGVIALIVVMVWWVVTTFFPRDD